MVAEPNNGFEADFTADDFARETAGAPTNINRSQALYRKWRSQTFAELVGQEAVTRTLKNAISAGRVAHAYLFCGPRGTGKTSMARLLAKAVNCSEPETIKRPCNRCEACLSIAEGRAVDLIEIDAASNNGVDNVRDLRDKIGYQPAQLRKKVYIIDEVHMLSDSAFNALLKTLEEPPPHAMFILATTDPQDIPATVVSRCQRFDFQRISLDQISQHLAFVCQQEKVQADNAALELLARQATGSMRDALSLLDQLIVYSGGVITLDAVKAMLGVMNTDAVSAFVDCLIAADLTAGLEQINNLVQSGSDLKRFNRELVDYLRGIMLVKFNPNSGDLLNSTTETLNQMRQQATRLTNPATLVNFLKVFSAVDYSLKVSPYTQLPLELALMDAVLPVANDGAASQTAATAQRPTPANSGALPHNTAVAQNSAASNSATPQRPTPVAPPAPVPINKNAASRADAPPVPAESPATAPAASNGTSFDLDKIKAVWPRFREGLGSVNKMTQALLLEASPKAVNGNQIVLAFRWPFHRERIAQDKMRAFVEEQFGKMLGQPVVIRCILEDKDDGSDGGSDGDSSGGDNSPNAPTKISDRASRYAKMLNATVREVNN